METSEHTMGDGADSGRTLKLAPMSKGEGAAAPAPMSTDLPEGVHLVDYLKVLYKRRWAAGTAFLLVLLSVTIYTFTVTPIYEARTRLLIEAEGPNVVNFAEVVDEQRAKADYYQTQYNILQSRQLARKTIDTLQLWTVRCSAASRAASPACLASAPRSRPPAKHRLPERRPSSRGSSIASSRT
jgi:uncharacterized protein involved in exopolysaccharide biosynthesis